MKRQSDMFLKRTDITRRKVFYVTRTGVSSLVQLLLIYQLQDLLSYRSLAMSCGREGCREQLL
jgi:hypothetical protein